MNLYEIEQEILSCIDQDTGEVVDLDRLSALQLERDTKLENVALWIKNLTADAAAYKAEKDAFAERERKARAKAESLKNWLSSALSGNAFATTKVAVSFRRSESVEVDEESVPKKWMRVTLAPDKTAIKTALKQGQRIKGCELVERDNIQIK